MFASRFSVDKQRDQGSSKYKTTALTERELVVFVRLFLLSAGMYVHRPGEEVQSPEQIQPTMCQSQSGH
jgi:hypothetical protein